MLPPRSCAGEALDGRGGGEGRARVGVKPFRLLGLKGNQHAPNFHAGLPAGLGEAASASLAMPFSRVRRKKVGVTPSVLG